MISGEIDKGKEKGTMPDWTQHCPQTDKPLGDAVIVINHLSKCKVFLVLCIFYERYSKIFLV